jgi:hypothetical protein
MGIQRILKSAFKVHAPTFDAEPVTFGASTVKAVIDNETRDGGLGYGSDEKKRRITLSVSTALMPKAPKFGSKFTARGKTWQIDRITPGLVAIQIEGVEPEKRSA